MSRINEAEFLRLAQEARARHIQHRKVIRLLLILVPIYLCFAAAFLLMIWAG
jgi:hypothetical protein